MAFSFEVSYDGGGWRPQGPVDPAAWGGGDRRCCLCRWERRPSVKASPAESPGGDWRRGARARRSSWRTHTTCTCGPAMSWSGGWAGYIAFMSWGAGAMLTDSGGFSGVQPEWSAKRLPQRGVEFPVAPRWEQTFLFAGALDGCAGSRWVPM